MGGDHNMFCSVNQPDIVERLSSLVDPMQMPQFALEAADEIERLRDLLGKANALARIRAERIKEIESDPALAFCHRFAVVMECMILGGYRDKYWTEATALLSEYQEADHKWRESIGEPYVSGFGKD